VIEVNFHTDGGGICMQFEVVQNWHASRGRTDCTIRGRLGIVPKRAFRV
jgi:hypothetical protein